MSEDDWLVLCALVIEHEHGYRHALHFMKRTIGEKPDYINGGPSITWWITTRINQFHHELMEDGWLSYDTKRRWYVMRAGS